MIKKLNLLIISCLLLLIITSCNKKCTVNFYVDNELIETIEVEKGETISQISTDPKKSGYIFIGWIYDGKLFDFSTSINKSIDLVAKFQTLPVACYTAAEKLLTGYDDVDGYAKLKDQVAIAVYSYNIDATTFENKIYSSFDTFINYLLESDNTKEILSFMVYYTDALIELHLKDQYYYQLSSSASTKAQDFYNVFIQSGYYNSNITSFSENIEFTNFIVPVMFNTLVLGTSYESAETWVIDATSKGLLKEFNVTKNNDKLVFKNKTNNEEFIYTYTDIEKFILGYQSIFKSTYSSTITLLTRSFEDKMKKLRCENLLPLYMNNDEELDNVVESFIASFSKELKDTYNSINILMGLESKFNSIVEEASKIESSEELDEVVKNALNFKDQVVEEVESIIPSDSIITNLDAINNALHIEEFIYAQTGFIPEINFDTLKSYYNEVVTFINSNLTFLKSINYTNYNIDVIVDGVLDETYRNFEYEAELEKLQNNYMKVINNAEILKTDLKELLDFSIFMNQYQGLDTQLIIDVLFNGTLTDDLLSLVISKLENTTIEYTEEELLALYNFIQKVSASSLDISSNEVNEYINIILKALNEIDKDMFITLKPCIKEALLIYMNDLDDVTINNILNCIEEDYEVFKTIIDINLHLSGVGNLQIGLTNNQLLLYQYEYLDSIIDTELMNEIARFVEEIYQILDEDGSEVLSILTPSIITRIDDCIVILKSTGEVEDADILYVNELASIFMLLTYEK